MPSQSAGMFFNNSSIISQLEDPEVQIFINKYGLKTYWHESTFEWFLYNDFFQIIMYREWGSFFGVFLYVPEMKISSVYHLGFLNGIDTEECSNRIRKCVIKEFSDKNISEDKIDVISFLREVSTLFEIIILSADECHKMFSVVERPKERLFSAQDRMSSI